MKRFLYICLSLVLLGLSVAIVGAISVYVWASADLPNIQRIDDYRPPITSRVYARDGSQIGIFFKEKRTLIALDQMTPHLPAAFLAAEDAYFYSHEGINPIAIARAFFVNLQSGTTRQGGSTITQQVIKRLLLTPERSYERKIKEAILAYRLESYLTKEDILTIYMNQIFLGSNAYGVEQAARTYFGKHAKDLTLAEAALIAGLPQAPSRYNPYRYPGAAKIRQKYVLERLYDLEWISKEEYDEALNQELVFTTMEENAGPESAYYLEEVRRLLIEELSAENMQKRGVFLPVYGEQALYELGLTIKTAMVPELQNAAYKALRQGLEITSKRQGWQGPVGQILESSFSAYRREQDFTPIDLADGAFVKALVTSVDKNSAKLALGDYSGTIKLEQMSWARKPNLKVSGLYAAKVSDARRVLAVGDIVWVSYFDENKAKLEKKGELTEEESAIQKAQSFEVLSTFSQSSDIPLALEQVPNVEGSLVSIEAQSGDVVALSGGYSFERSQFNRATQALRQPGSSFKPFVYSAALDKGYTPASIVLDAPVVYFNDATNDMWRPGNYEKNFRGPMLLRTALALSRNLCTIRVAQDIGVSSIIDRAKAMGFEGNFPKELSISLGAHSISPLNLTQAYTGFANQGLIVKPRFVLQVIDFNGRVILDYPTEQTQGISQQNAYLMASLLKEVVKHGTGRKANIFGQPLGGKTGTTNDERDAWFVAFTPSLVTSVFVGYDTPKPMGRSEIGGVAALPIFVDYAKEALPLYPKTDFVVPPGISFARVNALGQVTESSSDQRSYLLPFYLGTEPGQFDTQFSSGSPESGQEEDLLKNLF